MDLLMLSLVLVPLVLFFVAMLLEGKGAMLIITGTGCFFAVCSFVMSINESSAVFPVPSLFWKIISPVTVFFIFLLSLRDKQYIISVFTFIQAVILVCFEIFISPEEPDIFLYSDLREKLLLVSGAVIVISFVPFIIYCLKKYSRNSSVVLKRFGMGFALLLSSFAGLISAKSMTGLFLFWQWQYLSGLLFLKAFEKDETKRYFPRAIPCIQQAALTLFLIVSIIAYRATGSLAMQDFAQGFGKVSEIAALVIIMSVVSMGLLIPENYVPWFDYSKAVPIAGLYLIIFSLIVPYGVLLKFRPFFHVLYRGIITLMIFYGSLLVFSGACFALLHYRNRHSILSMIMSISGLAVATVFNDVHTSRDFLSGNPLPVLMVIAGMVLTIAYIIMWISSIFTHTSQAPEICDEHVISSIIPFRMNYRLIIRISWITTTALALGVSLLCLK
ncbi:MAG: hypothetical protein GXZ01_04570 [Clostridiaceae bacterium]|nr:hypothetical protein [Clostridiaceae bacterium]